MEVFEVDESARVARAHALRQCATAIELLVPVCDEATYFESEMGTAAYHWRIEADSLDFEGRNQDE